jgi:hypothetical protein
MLTLVTGKRATILLLIIAPLMIFCICFILPGRQWCIIKKISTNTAIFLLLISFSVITLHLNGIINIEFIAN